MIINQTVSGGGVAQIPNYYSKLTVNQDGELVCDYSQTVFSTAPATDIGQPKLFMDAFTNTEDPSQPLYNIQTVNLDSLEHISSDYAFTEAFMGVGSITSFSAANLIDITGTEVFGATFHDVYENSSVANYVSTFSFPSLVEASGDAVFSGTWSNNERVTTLSFPLLETVGASCFSYSCDGCDSLTSASFPSLSFVSAGAFDTAFTNIRPATPHTLTLTFGGTDPIDFDGNTDCFLDMLSMTNIDVIINAPLASQSDFESMDGYPDFGCQGTVTWNWQS